MATGLDKHIDLERISRRLEQLFAVGAPPHANRPGLSAEEQQACELAAGWMAEAGLAVSTDRFGNVFGRLVGKASEGEVWTGSHLDTVPAGGRFDGALGVVCGIEAVGALVRVATPVSTLAVVVFRDEEGWRFGGGTFGSRGICGWLTEEDLDTVDADGVTMRRALADLGLEVTDLDRASPLPNAFVELHIEQGPTLGASGHAIGSVSEIVGMLGGELVIEGRAGHAGTTPMTQRADAAVAAARATVALTDAAAGIPGAVATVGRLELSPGAANVIASRATLTLDLRAPDNERLDALAETVAAAGSGAASSAGCTWELRDVWRHGAVALDPTVRSAIVQSAASVSEPIREMSSGALHDAGVLAASGVLTGMIFVRSNAGGVSHTPEEDSDAGSISVATRVLARTLADLSGV